MYPIQLQNFPIIGNLNWRIFKTSHTLTHKHRSEQTAQTHYRLLKEQSDQDLHCFPFHQHLLSGTVTELDKNLAFFGQLRKLLCPRRNFGWHIKIAPSVRLSVRPSVSPSVTNRVSAISHKLLKQI